MNPSAIFWTALAVLTIIAILGAYLIYRSERAECPCIHETDWFRALMFTVGFFAILSLVGYVERGVLEVESAAQASSPKDITERQLALGYASCPPPGPGLTNVVTLIIESPPNEQPRVRDCVRFAERPFVPKRRGEVLAAQ